MMPNYVRAFVPGGTFFFAVVTAQRRPVFRDPAARRVLREAIGWVQERRPFDLVAMVLLPEHLHCIWTLPPDDSGFATRWRKIKEDFTRRYLAIGGVEAATTPGQDHKGQRGLWQRGYWEHVIRDERDFARHMDYIHYNPVKHELVRCPHDWEWSSFHRFVDEGVYDADWACGCRHRAMSVDIPELDDMAGEPR